MNGSKAPSGALCQSSRLKRQGGDNVPKSPLAGGTGNISLPCVVEAFKAGHRVFLFDRGKTLVGLPPGVTTLAGDLKDAGAYRQLGKSGFDVVCQFIAFTPAQMAEDIATFSGGTGQYVFISSASVYQKPPRSYVITEKTPTVNPYWAYSQNKIACEGLLKGSSGLPWTIVRPSHTVRSILPSVFNEGDALGHRMLAGKPVIAAGDGATLWTLTRWPISPSRSSSFSARKPLSAKTSTSHRTPPTPGTAFTWRSPRDLP